MNPVLRHGGALVLAVGMGGCKPPDPPLLATAPDAPSAIAPAQRAASNDDAALADVSGVEAGGVSVALDHAGEVLIGQRFSELESEGRWHSAGLAEATRGRCEYYERGILPEGVAMMVEDDHVVRFELAPIDASGLVVVQPGPYGVRLGMPLVQVVQRLPQGSVLHPAELQPGADGFVDWQDPGSDLAIRVEITEGVASTLYWGAGGAVELTEGCAADVR